MEDPLTVILATLNEAGSVFRRQDYSFGYSADIIGIFRQESPALKASRLEQVLVDRLDDYVAVEEKSLGLGREGLVGLRSLLLIKRRLRPRVKKYSLRVGLPQLTKGAHLFVVSIGDQTLALVNCHLPFSRNGQNWWFRRRRQSLAKILAFCQARAGPDAPVLLAGDLNMRVRVKHNGTKASNHMELLRHDEFVAIKEEFGLLEGVGNRGPTFLPTYKMKTSPDRIHFGDRDFDESATVPCWCDRIAYLNSDRLVCQSYKRFDLPFLGSTDHVLVVSKFLCGSHLENP
jgi:hypothetical protein